MCILKTQKTSLLSFQENERGMDRETDTDTYRERKGGKKEGMGEGEGGD